MLEQYFEVDEKRIGYFFGLVIGAVVVVTLIYWLVFGFNRWTGEMQRASDMMLAGVAAPVGQVYAAPTGQAYTAPVGQAYTAPSIAGQYVCPRDGAVGLPRFDANGVPHCPLDGQVMSFVPAQSGGMLPAAAPG